MTKVTIEHRLAAVQRMLRRDWVGLDDAVRDLPYWKDDFATLMSTNEKLCKAVAESGNQHLEIYAQQIADEEALRLEYEAEDERLFGRDRAVAA